MDQTTFYTFLAISTIIRTYHLQTHCQCQNLYRSIVKRGVALIGSTGSFGPKAYVYYLRLLPIVATGYLGFFGLVFPTFLQENGSNNVFSAY